MEQMPMIPEVETYLKVREEHRLQKQRFDFGEITHKEWIASIRNMVRAERRVREAAQKAIFGVLGDRFVTRLVLYPKDELHDWDNEAS